ncbi:hypothetical protein JYU34_011229 [Plutella xylostella]|uniref:Uncharacterized protein n=1 Tax=Plutella xylostella TaxID=51655 RepID=A0ABQ7QGD0_PLUXY|nr:hypothetical protein JYU34_011229 [Plutella xylostella]
MDGRWLGSSSVGNMSHMTFVCLALVACIIAMAQSQCVSRVRQVVPVQSCGCGDDLTTIVQLARALNEIEGGSCASPAPSSNSNLDTDGIITKLINALIYATVGGSPANNPLITLGLGGQPVLSAL